MHTDTLALDDTRICIACGLPIDACRHRCHIPARHGEYLLRYWQAHGHGTFADSVTSTGDTESTGHGEGV